MSRSPGGGGGESRLRALLSVSDTLIAFARNPLTFISTAVSLIIVEFTFGVIEAGAWIVLGTFDWIVYALDLVRYGVVVAFGDVGRRFLGGIADVGTDLAAATSSLGPAAPIVAGLVAGLVLLALYRVTVALAGEVPVGSSIVDILGLR